MALAPHDHLADALEGFSSGLLVVKDCLETPALFLVQLLINQALLNGQRVRAGVLKLAQRRDLEP